MTLDAKSCWFVGLENVGLQYISRTLGYKLVDHSDVVGAAPLGTNRRCSKYIFI